MRGRKPSRRRAIPTFHDIPAETAVIPLRPPPPFLIHRVHRVDLSPGITGLCVGYERGDWRNDQFADHVLDWLPEFALSWSEAASLHSGNARQLLRRAAQFVYSTDKYKKRGEFGEFFLHIAIRQVFQTVPAVSKIYFKDAANDTVKGFDCVHVVAHARSLEIWLGEAKFYSEISSAIRAACGSLESHVTADYLRSEMAAIRNKIDPNWPHAERLKRLMSEQTSLDDVFDALAIPVLLTYDSDTVRDHERVCIDYTTAFCSEVLAHHKTFSQMNPLSNLRVHLFLLPLEEKRRLELALDQRLKHWQVA